MAACSPQVKPAGVAVAHPGRIVHQRPRAQQAMGKGETKTYRRALIADMPEGERADLTEIDRLIAAVRRQAAGELSRAP